MPQISTDNGTLHYDLFDVTPPWIENPETILFHHGVAIDSGIWAGWWSALSDRYRLVIFDVRGYGRSSVPDETFDWSFKVMANDVMTVADEVNTERFHFVGESMGGAMGLYLAIHHPERLLSITPCTCPHKGGDVQWLVEWRDYIRENGVSGWADRMMGRRFYSNKLSKSAENWFANTQAASAAQSILGHGEMLLKVDLEDQLPSISTPTHLIAADNSPFLPLSITLAIRDGIQGAEMEVIPNSKHGVVFSHAQQCSESLRGFLDRLTIT